MRCPHISLYRTAQGHRLNVSNVTTGTFGTVPVYKTMQVSAFLNTATSSARAGGGVRLGLVRVTEL